MSEIRDDEAGDARGDGMPVRPGDSSPSEPRWVTLTWQWVAELADRVGRDADAPWGGPAWRREAIKGDAPAAHRALYELVWYLEWEGYAVLHPFDKDHAVALAHRGDSDEAARALLQRAAEADVIGPLAPEGKLVDYGLGWAQHFAVPPASWVDRLDGSVELMMWGNDEWADKPTGGPALAAGVSCGEEWYGPLAAQGDWLTRLRGLGVSFTADRGRVLALLREAADR